MKYETEIHNFLYDYDKLDTPETRELLGNFAEYLEDYFNEKIKRALE